MSGSGKWWVAGALVAALACGWVLGSLTSPEAGGELDDARRAVERLTLRAEAAESALRAARDDVRRPRRRPEGTKQRETPAGGAVAEPAAEVAAAAAEPAPLGPDERRRRVDEIRAQVPVWFDRGDGTALLEALRELAALAPEGRDAAMELALSINDDVSREGKLRLSQMTFYTALGDPAVSGLMTWALTEPASLSGFRVMAAYSLPWTQSAEKTLEQFRSVLAVEAELDVQRALVANLARLQDPRADAALGAILADTDSRPGLRAQVAGALIDATDDELIRALESAARDDPDPGVRAAATASLVARDPPATGYLVTGTVPDGQASAAGLLPGDIVVTYNGAETRTVDALRRATADAEGADDVQVIVRRGDQDVTLLVRPGRLGVFGRPVEAGEALTDGGAARSRDELEALATEAGNPRSADLDALDADALVRLVFSEDRAVQAACDAAATDVGRLVDAASSAVVGGGRLVYVGAGTSGRLALLDAVELGPTFGVAPDLVPVLLAGGREAVWAAREGAEDSAADGARELAALAVGPDDFVVGVSASGRTPYTLGALAEARRRGAATGAIVCNPVSAAFPADVVAVLATGPEVLAGSTRMKAGTATKRVLNAISLGAMVRLGKVYRNRMVDVRVTSEKLRDRAERLVCELGAVAPDEAGRLLTDAGGNAKTAIVMARHGLDAAAARARLDAVRGSLRRALGEESR